MENALKKIRKDVFGIGQAEFAIIAGATQATISRWETGELEPNLRQMQAIRSAALSRNIDWHDDWFFDSDTVGVTPQPREVA